eukprot:SAG31_NODE_24807_length_473_cov_10.213904_1_plen_36_part_10
MLGVFIVYAIMALINQNAFAKIDTLRSELMEEDGSI